MSYVVDNRKVKLDDSTALSTTHDVFSFDRVYAGDKNAYTRQISIFGGATTGTRLLQTDLTQSAMYTRPASNVNVQIVSSASGDTSIPFVLRGVDVNGAAVTLNMSTDASNGTTVVNTGTKQVVMINDIYPTTTAPTGTITVKIDKDNNGSYSFTLGAYKGGQFKTAIHVVPTGKVAYLTRAQLSNAVDKSAEFRFYLRVTPLWTSGAAPTSEHIMEIYVNNTAAVEFKNYCETIPIIAPAGSLLAAYTYTASSLGSMANFTIVECDS